jgi:hypothetical protein
MPMARFGVAARKGRQSGSDIRIREFCDPVRPLHHMSVSVIDLRTVRVCQDQVSASFVSIRDQDMYCLIIP